MAKQEGKKMDMQAMMEVYKKVGTPGAPHKLLAGLEGTKGRRQQDEPVQSS